MMTTTTPNIRLRTSILRTFGFIVLVIGLVLTVYGHLAGRHCVECDHEPDRESEPNKSIQNPLPWRPRKGPRDEDIPNVADWQPPKGPKDGDVDHFPFQDKADLDHQGHVKDSSHLIGSAENAGVNKNAIRYAKIVGPVALVLGLLLIVLSTLLSRRSKLNDSLDLNDKIHWTEEIMRDERKRRSEGLVSIEHIHESTQLQIHAQTQYFVTTSHDMDRLPNTSILDPPPSYEASINEQHPNNGAPVEWHDIEGQQNRSEGEADESLQSTTGVPPPSYKTASMVNQ